MKSSPYAIGDSLYKSFSHHESLEQLWATKWRVPCSTGVYPFVYSALEDFEPIITNGISSNLQEPYDWDRYASIFKPRGETLVAAATKAKEAGQNDKAVELFLRASAVYRISRYPVLRSPLQFAAWEEGKKAFYAGQSLLPCGVRPYNVPFVHRTSTEGTHIPICGHIPQAASKEKPAPVLILQCGLDSYRTDNSYYSEGLSKYGIALFCYELPGTADSPADPSDPVSTDRQTASLLDWIKDQPELDETRVCLWGISTGGRDAVRAAHVHKDKLLAVVGQGAGCHHMFDRDWLDNVDHLEYPFDLAESMAIKFGFGDDIEIFKTQVQAKHSLLLDGTLDKPCTKLLLVNGIEDSIFPIDDIYLMTQHGPSPKQVRTFAGLGHMGNPAGGRFIVDWLFEQLQCERQPGDVEACFKILDTRTHI